MKMLWIVADASHLEAYRHALLTAGAPGYTLLPVLEGAGSTGTHAGDRVHPGALVALACVAEPARSEALFTAVLAAREAAGDRITRVFQWPVERMA
jgi:hypothetical protein